MKSYDEKQCAVCPRPGKACSRCNCSFYCSKECQKVDWPLHRTLCASFTKFKDRPHPRKRRAIYFPVDKARPEFVWLPLNDDDGPDFDAIRKMFFDQCRIWPVHVREDPLMNIHLRHQIQLQCRSDFQGDGSPVNQCIYRLSNKTCSYFKGPALALASIEGSRSIKTGRITHDMFGRRVTQCSKPKRDGLQSGTEAESSGSDDSGTDWSDEEEFVKWKDMDTSDLRSIMNFIMVTEPTYNDQSSGVARAFVVSTATNQPDHMSQGVRINTDGDLRVMNWSIRFEELNTVSPIGLHVGEDSQIGRLFGMPLWIMPTLREEDDNIDPEHQYSAAEKKPVRDTIKLGRLNMPADSHNPLASMLMTEISSKNMAIFGTVPQAWKADDIGPVCVFRKDGLPLSATYLNSFCIWIRDDLAPMFSNIRKTWLNQLKNESVSEDELEKNVTKLQKEMLDRITRARFYAWCNNKGVELKHL